MDILTINLNGLKFKGHISASSRGYYLEIHDGYENGILFDLLLVNKYHLCRNISKLNVKGASWPYQRTSKDVQSTIKDLQQYAKKMNYKGIQMADGSIISYDDMAIRMFRYGIIYMSSKSECKKLYDWANNISTNLPAKIVGYDVFDDPYHNRIRIGCTWLNRGDIKRLYRWIFGNTSTKSKRKAINNPLQ